MLHPHHCLLVKTRQLLLPLYTTADALQRKRQLAQEVTTVMGTLDPVSRSGKLHLMQNIQNFTHLNHDKQVVCYLIY